jgi:hypothetical protein
MLVLHKHLPEAWHVSREDCPASGQIEVTDGQIDGGLALLTDGGGDRNCGRGKPDECAGESL